MRQAATWQCAKERGGGATTVDRMQDDTAPAPDARLQTATSADVGASYQEDRLYLIRFLLRHGAEYAEAEDAVHSAFVELIRSRQAVRSPRAWLRTGCPEDIPASSGI